MRMLLSGMTGIALMRKYGIAERKQKNYGMDHNAD